MSEPVEMPEFLELDDEFGLDDMSHLGRALAEEMIERDWSFRDVATRMVAADATSDELAVAWGVLTFAIYSPDPCLRLDSKSAEQLARAFDVEAELFLNLNRRWIAEHPK